MSERHYVIKHAPLFNFLQVDTKTQGSLLDVMSFTSIVSFSIRLESFSAKSNDEI